MLESFFRLLLEKFWKRWLSIPIFIFFILIILVNLIPEKWDISDHNALIFYVTSFVALALFLLYLILCCKENILPKAKGLAVLFIVDTESPTLFQEVKNKLITNFADSFGIDNEFMFSSICLSKDKVSKYNLNKKADLLTLLDKTNCAFFVRVRYLVDSVSNTEKYEMGINLAVVHPTFEKNNEKIFQTEMNLLSSPIKKKKFNKNNNIENLDFTAQALSFICQYLLSIVLYLSGDLTSAHKILSSLYLKSQNGNEVSIHYIEIVKTRLYEVCMVMTSNYYDSFYSEKSDKTLALLNEKIEEANLLFPNTYDYYLGKAYYLIAFCLDSNKAQKCINECKKMSISQTWKYSEAFLSAFNHSSPNIIIRKYKAALKVPFDLPRIADYIEYIIEKAPEHKDLHLAVALVYDSYGEYILASDHFNEYLQTESGEQISEFINKKLSSYPNDLPEYV